MLMYHQRRRNFRFFKVLFCFNLNFFNIFFYVGLNWYFLVSTNYFLYGESIIHYFKQFGKFSTIFSAIYNSLIIVLVDAFLMPLATHHRFISFTLYIFGFVLFVMNLKKSHYKFQFTQFAWTHMTLLLVVIQSHFIINNIFEGIKSNPSEN